ncbi:unnamed protein product, partial [Lampetra fluviatilis]
VHRGIKGVVLDPEGVGIPNAVVAVEEIDHDVTTGAMGDYFRLLNPGEYKVTVRADGFTSVTRTCQVDYDMGASPCDFHLSRSNRRRILEILRRFDRQRLLSRGRTSGVPLPRFSQGRAVQRVKEGRGIAEARSELPKSQRQLPPPPVRHLQARKLSGIDLKARSGPVVQAGKMAAAGDASDKMAAACGTSAKMAAACNFASKMAAVSHGAPVGEMAPN